MEYSQLRLIAIEAAEAGAAITKEYFGRIKQINQKPNAGLVTEADRKAEERIISVIKTKFPDHQIFAEESGEQKSHSRVRWIIDPLDGTTNYAHRLPIYCISIGVEVDGEIVVGVINIPILREVYIAVKGCGATLNGEKISVSSTTKLKDSLLATGFSYKKGKIIDEEIKRFKNLLSACRAVRRLGSAAIDMAYVASGIYDGFWEVDLSPWDVAAGSVIVKEAGGKLSDFSGGKFDSFGKEILASNGQIHQELISTL